MVADIKFVGEHNNALAMYEFDTLGRRISRDVVSTNSLSRRYIFNLKASGQGAVDNVDFGTDPAALARIRARSGLVAEGGRLPLVCPI